MTPFLELLPEALTAVASALAILVSAFELRAAKKKNAKGKVSEKKMSYRCFSTGRALNN